jgi:hypothetical protein
MNTEVIPTRYRIDMEYIAASLVQNAYASVLLFSRLLALHSISIRFLRRERSFQRRWYCMGAANGEEVAADFLLKGSEQCLVAKGLFLFYAPLLCHSEEDPPARF